MKQTKIINIISDIFGFTKRSIREHIYRNNIDTEKKTDLIKLLLYCISKSM